MSIFASIQKYLALAITAVHEAEASATPGATKKQIAVASVLAAAHAGETIDNATVQKISGIVEFAVSIANALGLLGKAPASPVVVPPTEVLDPQ